MTQPSQTWTSHSDNAPGNPTPSQGGYHPHCGEEHHHKPTKAIIGVSLLVVLSFLFYEFKSPDAKPLSGAAAQHQVAANH